MVCRHGTIKKFKEYVAGGNILHFVANFLSNRTFSVRIGNTLSPPHYVENGLPQGSVLSVTLFIITMDDVFHNIKSPVKASCFVDDLVIFTKGKKEQSAQIILLIYRELFTNYKNGVTTLNLPFLLPKLSVCFSQDDAIPVTSSYVWVTTI